MVSGPLSYRDFRETGPGPVKLPGLSRNGPQVCKWVWKMKCFGLKLGHDLENRAAHSYQEFRAILPPSGG